MTGKTIDDLSAFMQQSASKDDIAGIKAKIDDYTTATNIKITQIKGQVNANKHQSDSNSVKINELQTSIEMIKQDQLKNNVCISGIPIDLVKNESIANLIIEIAKKLGIELNINQFSAYPVANNKFVVVRFFNLKHKQLLLSKIRIKKKSDGRRGVCNYIE